MFQACDDETDSHYAELAAMAAEIAALRTHDGKPYRLFPLPWAQPILDDGRRLAASYANFLIVNGAVLMPAYGDPADDAAAAVMANAFPGREIVQILPPADLAERQPALPDHAVARGADVMQQGRPADRPYNARMKTKTLPVALVQERNHGDAEANLAVIETRVAEAAKSGARLVLLQELHNGAYFCQHERGRIRPCRAIPARAPNGLGKLWRSGTAWCW